MWTIGGGCNVTVCGSLVLLLETDCPDGGKNELGWWNGDAVLFNYSLFFVDSPS